MLAKLSALAKITQLTTISGKYKPKDSYSGGISLSSTKRTIVTKVAIINTKAGIRTSLGIIFLKRETSTLLQIKTKVTASPIPTPFIAIVVKARVGQVPKTNFNEGFCAIKPSEAILPKLTFFIC